MIRLLELLEQPGWVCWRRGAGWVRVTENPSVRGLSLSHLLGTTVPICALEKLQLRTAATRGPVKVTGGGACPGAAGPPPLCVHGLGRPDPSPAHPQRPLQASGPEDSPILSAARSREGQNQPGSRPQASLKAPGLNGKGKYRTSDFRPRVEGPWTDAGPVPPPVSQAGQPASCLLVLRGH